MELSAIIVIKVQNNDVPNTNHPVALTPLSPRALSHLPQSTSTQIYRIWCGNCTPITIAYCRTGFLCTLQFFCGKYTSCLQLIRHNLHTRYGTGDSAGHTFRFQFSNVKNQMNLNASIFYLWLLILIMFFASDDGVVVYGVTLSLVPLRFESPVGICFGANLVLACLAY